MGLGYYWPGAVLCLSCVDQWEGPTPAVVLPVAQLVPRLQPVVCTLSLSTGHHIYTVRR